MAPFYILFQLRSVFMTYPVQYKVITGGLLRQNGFKYTFTNLNHAAPFQCKHVDFRSCTL